MYSAVIEGYFVFSRNICVYFLRSQVKRNQVFTKKFIKRFLYFELHVLVICLHLHNLRRLTTRRVATGLRVCVGRRLFFAQQAGPRHKAAPGLVKTSWVADLSGRCSPLIKSLGDNEECLTALPADAHCQDQ